MPISREWDINYTTKTISHQDGRLFYFNGAGTIPTIEEALTGTISRACAVILTASVGSTLATGSLFLTDARAGISGAFLSPFIAGEALTGSSRFPR